MPQDSNPDPHEDGQPDADQDRDAYGNSVFNADWYRHADAHGFTYSFTYRDRDALSLGDAKRYADKLTNAAKRMLLNARGRPTADPNQDGHAASDANA